MVTIRAVTVHDNNILLSWKIRMLTNARTQRRRRSERFNPLSVKYARSKPTVGIQGNEPLAAIAHDAHNVVAALRLYCDLLAEPGVLAEGKQHFADGVTSDSSSTGKQQLCC